MSHSGKIRLLIADDHPVVRKGLVAMIEDEPDMSIVAEAADGHQAVELFCQHRPDVALIDLRMPKMNGVEAIAAIRKQSATARLIILTTYDTDEEIYRGLREGAKGYLLKDTTLEDLLECIRAVFTGKTYVPLPVAAKLAERTLHLDLNERELEVLRLIVVGKSNREIGLALGIAERTVKFHVNHLLSKLGVSDRTQAVITALRRGLVQL